jgi:hypothetical protein
VEVCQVQAWTVLAAFLIVSQIGPLVLKLTKNISLAFRQSRPVNEYDVLSDMTNLGARLRNKITCRPVKTDATSEPDVPTLPNTFASSTA